MRWGALATSVAITTFLVWLFATETGHQVGVMIGAVIGILAIVLVIYQMIVDDED